MISRCHHHHHITLVARISLTLSRHSSLSFIGLGRSSGQHSVSSHSCWMYVRAGRPAFARPCVGVHKSTSLMSSSLLLQQCPFLNIPIYFVQIIKNRWIIVCVGWVSHVHELQATWSNSYIRNYDRQISHLSRLQITNEVLRTGRTQVGRVRWYTTQLMWSCSLDLSCDLKLVLFGHRA